jgi:predicted Zn-dependent protease
MKKEMFSLAAGVGLLGGVAGCALNPVTGHRDVGLLSPDREIAIGEELYASSRQLQGGDYSVDPALTDYVRRVGMKVAAVSDRKLSYEFAVLNGSAPNAWALPGGKIAVNRGLLLELGSEAELAAVLAHEIVHAAARHGTLSLQSEPTASAPGLPTQSDGHGSVTVGPASLGVQLIAQRYSRDEELEADRYGMTYMARAGYDAGAAVSLQRTFVRASERSSRDRDELAVLFAHHPPSDERLQKDAVTAATLPEGGEIGRDRYRSATAALRKHAPAYKAYDDGRKALDRNDPTEAERLGQQAVRLYPAEAQFHALLGDVDFAAHRYDAAAQHYDAAIARDDQFFYYHLQAGLAHGQLRELDSATRELEASLGLLPTAEAHYALGAIAEQRGDSAAALAHYAKATELTKSSVGPRNATARAQAPESAPRSIAAAK